MIYRLKEGFGSPKQFLGANFERVKLDIGRVFCFANCVDYLKRDIYNVNNSLGVDNMAPKNDGYGHMPYSCIFSPELEVTE